MTDQETLQYRTSALSHRKPTRFRFAPEAPAQAAIADSLELIAVTDLTFDGEITPAGRADFVLTGRLRANAVQACVVTLAPVPARIDEQVLRRYLAVFDIPEGDETEMPDDDSAEPMPELIDLTTIVVETLTLALPPYPRAPGAELGEAVFAEQGTAPLRDQDLRPFAGLASLVKKDADDGE